MGSVLATSCSPDVRGYFLVKRVAVVPLGQPLGGTILPIAERKNNISFVLLATFVLAAS
jgi:hypothetical protein